MRRKLAITLLALLWRHLLIAPWAMLFAAYFLTGAAAATPLTFVDGSAHFGATHRANGQAILDDWTFTLAAPATANASLISIALGTTNEFRIDDAELLGDGLVVAFDSVPSPAGLQVLTLAPSFLHAGDYTLRVTGYVPAGAVSGSYAGTVNVSPIPEPRTTALLAAGLAAVVWIARRKQPKD